MQLAPTLPLIIVTMSTGALYFAHYRTRGGSVFELIKCAAAGAGLFGAAFVLQLIPVNAGIDSTILNVIIEESLKAGIVYSSSKNWRAIPIISSFATIEVISKYVFLFILGGELNRGYIDSSWVFFLCALVSAYVMHMTTAVLYCRLSIFLAFPACAFYHLIYNFLAIGAESRASRDDGLLLLLSAFIVPAILIGGVLSSRLWRSPAPRPEEHHDPEV